jgi:hypothetical protein
MGTMTAKTNDDLTLATGAKFSVDTREFDANKRLVVGKPFSSAIGQLKTGDPFDWKDKRLWGGNEPDMHRLERLFRFRYVVYAPDAKNALDAWRENEKLKTERDRKKLVQVIPDIETEEKIEPEIGGKKDEPNKEKRVRRKRKKGKKGKKGKKKAVQKKTLNGR